MKSNPITQRACTKYGSAPKNLEVTVDAAGTTPAKFEKMTPLKQLTRPGDDTENRPVLLEDAANSDSGGGGGSSTPVDNDSVESNNVFGGHGLGESAPDYQGPSARFNKNPFYFDTGLDTSNVGTSSEPPSLMDSNKEMNESKNRPVEVEMPEVDMTPIEAPKFISSGTGDTGDSGRFVGPYERRQRGRAVKYTANQARRQAMASARDIARGYDPKTETYDESKKLKGKDRRKFLKQERMKARAAKREAVSAEQERIAKSNVDAYKTKFRGSGDPDAARAKFKSIGTDIANTDFSVKRNSSKPSLTTKPANSKTAGNYESARISNKFDKTPLFKMGGYGTKAYKK